MVPLEKEAILENTEAIPEQSEKSVKKATKPRTRKDTKSKDTKPKEVKERKPRTRKETKPKERKPKERKPQTVKRRDYTKITKKEKEVLETRRNCITRFRENLSK